MAEDCIFLSKILQTQSDDDNWDVKKDARRSQQLRYGCEVKIRSMNEEEDSNLCVGSFIIFWRPYWDVTFSSVIPFELFLSCLNQLLDLPLKSPRTTTKNELF